MKKLFYLLLIVLFCFSCNSEPAEPPSDYKVVAYVAGWKEINADSIPAEKITHINYAFADVDSNGQVVSYLGDDLINFAALNELKLRNPKLKILISLGGWSRSKGFSDAALTPTSRKIFAESALDFVFRYELDGVDVDWEYPGQPGDNNPYRKEDKENFTLLLQALKDELQRGTIMEDREDEPYILTIAAATDDDWINNTEMKKVAEILDFVNIMTYDFAGPWVDTARHHANLYPSTQKSGSLNSVQESVERFLKAGVPAEKLVVGVPFYGRSWAGVEGMNMGTHGEKRSYGYHTIRQELLQDSTYQRKWDEEAQAPYLWRENDQTFITYEDTTSLRLKIDFVKENDLAGIMFWEYYQDTTGLLLNELYEGLQY